MRLILDEIQHEVTADSIGDAITAAAGLAEQGGRIIVDVIVDGATWSLDQLNSKELAGAGADEVRCVSEDPCVLARGVFTDAGLTLDEVDARHREAADLLQAGKRAEAMAPLSDAVNMWLTVQQAVELGTRTIAAFAAESDEPALDATIMPVLKQTNDHLMTLRTAITDDDEVVMADLLLYELPAIVIEWRALLLTLEQRLHAEG